MSSRFFVPPEQITHNRFFLVGSEARHASVVLRKKVGDTLDLFDGKDLSYHGRIDSISPERVEGTLLAERKVSKTSPVDLVLCQALIKGPKWDWLVEKACEIGVAKLVPLLTARTIVKPSRVEARGRWKRIALSAAKQCGRQDLMDVQAPKTLSEAFEGLPKDSLALIPWEKETKKTIRQAMVSHSDATTPIVLFIGPEGGWEDEEIKLALRHGVVPVRLGPTLLRSETAGLVAATLVLSEGGVYS